MIRWTNPLPITIHSDVSHYHILQGDSRSFLRTFQSEVDLIVTSPPYADARKKHYESPHPDHYTDWFASFHEGLWQALKPNGSLVINLKDKIVDGVRHRYVWHTIERLTALGWYCIDDYIWAKKTAMPGYWPTRLRDAWEYCFHLAKCKRPYINQHAVKIPMAASTRERVDRASSFTPYVSATGSGFTHRLAYWQQVNTVLPSNVLHLAPENRNQGHPAAFPLGLPRFFIQLLSPPDGLVLDPFSGSGSTGVAALELNRRVILIDQCEDYCKIAKKRLMAAQHTSRENN